MLSANDASVLEPPTHGSDVEAASARYGIPSSDWLDLSAAINPHAYSSPSLQPDALRQLPYSLRATQEAAKNYCSAPTLPIFAAGSQVLIQWLPFVHCHLHTGRRVAVPSIGYAEHAFRWQWAGYEIVFYDPRVPEQIDVLLQRDAIDVLVVITPHNPLAHCVTPRQLLTWHAALQRNNGWLVVDEAFADATPEISVASIADAPGLIVLRSLGKFFGLAGARCGYAFCHPNIGEPLAIAIGPWPLSTPTLSIATHALRDTEWQRTMRKQLAQWSVRNVELFKDATWVTAGRVYRHALFNSIELPSQRALMVEDYFAMHAIRVRRIDIDADTALLRFGLIDPADAQNWLRLKGAIDGAPCLNAE